MIDRHMHMPMSVKLALFRRWCLGYRHEVTEDGIDIQNRSAISWETQAQAPTEGRSEALNL